MTIDFAGSHIQAAVIGGGPAGLMAAEVLCEGGVKGDLFDVMPSVGRKFLVAGKGGLNLTHSEPLEQFLDRYGSRRPQLEPFLREFGPMELREWAAGLGVGTFTGTSGRVFPTGMKAAPLLYAWRKRLENGGVNFHQRYKWLGWNEDQCLRFNTPDGETTYAPDIVVLALGGASWARLGSSGEWAGILAKSGLPLEAFKPANCGFDIPWSAHFKERFDGHPVKTVALEFTGLDGESHRRQGEFIITTTGVEGSLIYAFSAQIRDMIEKEGRAVIRLDLNPDRTVAELAGRLAVQRGSRSMSHHLERMAGIRGVKAGLLWECLLRADFDDPQNLPGR